MCLISRVNTKLISDDSLGNIPPLLCERWSTRFLVSAKWANVMGQTDFNTYIQNICHSYNYRSTGLGIVRIVVNRIYYNHRLYM